MLTSKTYTLGYGTNIGSFSSLSHPPPLPLTHHLSLSTLSEVTSVYGVWGDENTWL